MINFENQLRKIQSQNSQSTVKVNDENQMKFDQQFSQLISLMQENISNCADKKRI